MRRKPYLTTGALFMGLIIVLGAIGIVNGLWSKTLRVDGTVTTGDLNADWNCAYTNDDGAQTLTCPDADDDEAAGDLGADPIDNTWSGITRRTGMQVKDVGYCEVVVDPAGDTPDAGKQLAKVTIRNAYPSYECKITLALSNTGSIPFNFIGVTYDLPAELELLDGVCQTATTPQQIDPGEDELVSCTVHVKQIAEQSTCTGTTAVGGVEPDTFPAVTESCDAETLTEYEFQIGFCAAQWNEEADLAKCVTEKDEGPVIPAVPTPPP